MELSVDPKFVLEVASGLRDPEIIAEEYGYAPEQWASLQLFPPFIRAVDDKKLELQTSGWTFKLKAAMAAEDLLADVYAKAKEEDASFHTTLEALKFMARAAGLDAPTQTAVDAGPAFSITIDLGGGQSVQINTKQSKSSGAHGEITDVEAEEGAKGAFISFPAYIPMPLPA